jgi:uncharacterized membrane protein
MNEGFPRILAVLLLVSLAANCLLVGLILGRTVDIWPFAPRPPASQPVQIAGFGARVQELPDPDKRAFHAAMAPDRPAIRQARQAVTVSRQAVADAISREPYDAQAVIDAFAELRQKTDTLQQRAEESGARALSGVSEAGRRLLVK